MSTEHNPDEDRELIQKRRGELVLSSLFMLLSVWFMYRSVVMSIIVRRRTGATIYTLPGMFPFIVSLLIFICSLSVVVFVLRKNILLPKITGAAIRGMLENRELRIFLFTMGWMFVYVVLLIPYIPFEIATFVFITTLFLVFRAAKPAWSVLIGLLFSIVVVYFFTAVVRTPFPHTLF